MECKEFKTYGASITVIDREGEAGKDRYHYAAFPRGPILVRPYNAMDDSITDVVFNLNVIDNSARKPRELVRKGRTKSTPRNLIKRYGLTR
jgi:hypothetical protein